MKTGKKADIERLVVGALAANCYILKSGDELAVIDPGGESDRILGKVKKLGGEVKLVVNTHGHIDHVEADRAVVEATGAELVIHEADAGMLENPDAGLGVLMGLRARPVSPTRTVEEGDELSVGTVRLKVVHTPGHTPGGICLVGEYAEAGKERFAFTGDTLFVDSIGRTDFPGGSEQQMQASLSRLQAILAKETMLYPGHGEPGTFGRALLVNPFLGSVWPA